MKTAFVFLVILFLFACAGFGLAGTYRQIQHQTPTYYQQPSYAYNSPGYSQGYQQSYNTNGYATNGYRQRVRFVSIASVAQINPAYVSSYSPDTYDSSTQVELVAEVRRLRALLDAQAIAAAVLARGGTTLPPAQSAVVPQPLMPYVPPVAAAQPPAAGPPATQPPVPKALTGGAAGLAVLMAKCSACHQAGHLTPDQRFTLLDQKGQLSPLNDKQKLGVLMRVYKGMMPPPSNIQGITPVTDAEYAQIADLFQ